VLELIVLLALVIIGVFTIMGLKVGLVRRVVEFAGVVASFLVATNLAPRLFEGLARSTGLQEKAALYTTWVVLFLFGLVITRLVAWVVSKTIRISVIGWLDRLGGALLGLLIGTVLVSVVLIALSHLPGGRAVQEAFNQRPATRAIYQAAPWLLATFRRLGGDEQEIWDRILQELKEQTATSAAAPSAPPSGNLSRG
jgi:membrane protein required for colicin V production